MKKLIIFSFILNFSLTNLLYGKELKNQSDWSTTLTPLYEDFLVSKLPLSWPVSPAHEVQNNNHYLLEFLPKNQTFDGREEMISIQALRDQENSPKKIFAALISANIDLCQQGKTDYALLNEMKNEINGIIFCGEIKDEYVGFGLKKGQGETGFYRIYKSHNNILMNYYSIWTKKPFDPKKPPAEMIKKINEFIIQTNSNLVCDRNKPTGKCIEYSKLLIE